MEKESIKQRILVVLLRTNTSEAVDVTMNLDSSSIYFKEDLKYYVITQGYRIISAVDHKGKSALQKVKMILGQE